RRSAVQICATSELRWIRAGGSTVAAGMEFATALARRSDCSTRLARNSARDSFAVSFMAALSDLLVMNMSRPRILAIEADPDRRLRLERFRGEGVDADVAFAESAQVEARAIHFQLPDLVVASMLLPPSEDARVMSHLNAIDDASRPAVLIVPPL